MANPDDFPQPIEGQHDEGDSVVADQFHLGVVGKDENTQYVLFRIYSDGSAAGQGLGVLPAQDGSGNLHYLKSTTDGELIVNIGAEDSAFVAGNANLVKDTATDVVSEAPGSTTKYIGMSVSGSGLCEWDLQFGATASETTQMIVSTTPSNRAMFIDFPAPLEVASGETIKIVGTNREKGASPTSDFTGYASLVKEA